MNIRLRNVTFLYFGQIKQARKFVEQEQKARQKAEAERDNLQKQLQSVKDLLLADGGKTINNETLERIRYYDIEVLVIESPVMTLRSP